MATREFTDESGTQWTVWTTFPTGFHVLTPDYAQGWLTFESAAGLRRRLAPIPPGWELMMPNHLIELCRRATPVRSVRGGVGDTPLDLPAISADDSPEQSA